MKPSCLSYFGVAAAVLFLFTSRSITAEPLTPVPVVFSVSPGSARPGENVTIFGTNFIGVRAVLFNGINAHFGSVNGPGLEKDAPLWAMVPEEATSGPLTVITVAGEATHSQDFVVLREGPQPMITHLSESSGLPGGSITVYGENLIDVLSINFNGVESMSFTFFPFGTEVLVGIPQGATTGPITIVTRWGQSTTTEAFQVRTLQSIPKITGFSPSTGHVGSLITVTGENLIDILSVRLGEVPAEFIPFTPDTLTVLVPPGATNGTITVETSHGIAVTAESFVVIERPAPTITSIFPERAPMGRWVEINGHDLDQPKAVLFNGTPARIVETVGDFVIHAIVPTNSTAGPITVLTAAGLATSPQLFTPMPSGDLLLTQEISTDLAVVGQDLTYTWSITNRGPTDVSGLVLTNLIALEDKWAQPVLGHNADLGQPNISSSPPAYETEVFSVKELVSSQGSARFESGALSCELGPLEVGNIAKVSLTIRPLVPGKLAHLAVLRGADDDLDFASNLTSACTRVLGAEELFVRIIHGQQCEISWSTDSPDFVLQVTDDISLSSNWRVWDGSTEQQQGRNTVLEQPGEARYFRLIRAELVGQRRQQNEN